MKELLKELDKKLDDMKARIEMMEKEYQQILKELNEIISDPA